MTKFSQYSNMAIGASFAAGYIYSLETVFQLVAADLSNSNLQLVGTYVLMAACLNVLSHTAVVVGALNDTYVFSILIGVGFDVFSTMLYLNMWREVLLTRSPGEGRLWEEESVSPVVLVVLGSVCCAVTLLQWLSHVRALLLSSSATRLKSVVRSAWNNLRGKPGLSYEDHLVAFTDLGYHIFHMSVAIRLVGWRTSLVLLGLLVTVAVAIFFGGGNFSTSLPENQLPPGLLRISKDGKPVCSCEVCLASGQSSKAFSIDLMRWQLCQLWFQSFGQVCNLLDDLELES